MLDVFLERVLHHSNERDEDVLDQIHDRHESAIQSLDDFVLSQLLASVPVDLAEALHYALDPLKRFQPVRIVRQCLNKRTEPQGLFHADFAVAIAIYEVEYDARELLDRLFVFLIFIVRSTFSTCNTPRS